MLSGFVNVICEIGIFMICTGAIVNFRPKASYEKYLKMLVSAMVLMQLFAAIDGFFSTQGKLALQERIQWFTEDADDFFSQEELEFRMEVERVGADEVQEAEKPPIIIEIPPIAPINISDIVVGHGE